MGDTISRRLMVTAAGPSPFVQGLFAVGKGRREPARNSVLPARKSVSPRRRERRPGAYEFAPSSSDGLALPKLMNLLKTTLLVLCSALASGQDPKTPEQVIAEMHARYAETWYRTLAFDQQSVTHKPDGTTSSETWHEALQLPGRLRIDFGDPAAGNGVLFANDRQYVYKAGKLTSEKAFIHPLLVLGFDVYRQPPDMTLRQLKDLHMDLSVLHDENWNGRPTLVVGAKAGDLRSPQFWIDRERLYFVRLLQPDPKDPMLTQDIRFEDYRRVERGAWVSEHVLVYSGGKLVFEEKYSNVRVNHTLQDQLFDPQKFVSSKN